MSLGRGTCISGYLLTMFLLQRRSHSWRCSFHQLRMLAAFSSPRRSVGSKRRKRIVWETGGHEGSSSSVLQARPSKTCPDLPLVRARALLCILPWAWPCSPRWWKWVSDNGGEESSDSTWVLWLPSSFVSSVGVGSLGSPRESTECSGQDLVQMDFNKYFSSNLSDCVLGTEERKVPRAAFEATPCHPMPTVTSRA